MIALFLWGPMAIREGRRAGWFYALAIVLITLIVTLAYVTFAIAPTPMANYGLVPAAHLWYALAGTLYWLTRKSSLAKT